MLSNKTYKACVTKVANIYERLHYLNNCSVVAVWVTVFIKDINTTSVIFSSLSITRAVFNVHLFGISEHLPTPSLSFYTRVSSIEN